MRSLTKRACYLTTTSSRGQRSSQAEAKQHEVQLVEVQILVRVTGPQLRRAAQERANTGTGTVVPNHRDFVFAQGSIPNGNVVDQAFPYAIIRARIASHKN